jgi:hypothetical protein
MSISDLIMCLIWVFLFGILISRTIKSVKENNYKRKTKKIERKRKKALDDYTKSQEIWEDIDEIDEFDDTDEEQELENFIEDVEDAWFDIDEEEALQYISDWKSPEDYVTYMEDFYQWDDDISDDDSDNNSEEKAEDYINDMSSLWYDITDDEAIEMAEEWFDPEEYADECAEENDEY